jgi:hypothetical protein
MKSININKLFEYYYYRLIFALKIFYVSKIYSHFSKTVRQQLRNYKEIPIVIVNFNQLENLKKLVNYLMSNGYNNIHIIDNNSTYKPLLSYYKVADKRINIYLNNFNYGHMVFWKKSDFFKKFSKGYYVVTDPDVLPVDECPPDFLNDFFKTLRNLNSKYKVGFSLKIDDIPNNYALKDEVLKWEDKYWKKVDANGNYIADIDTTFALYRPKLRTKKFFYTGLRMSFPYEARHLGWYIDSENLSDEQKFYKETVNASSSWIHKESLSKLNPLKQVKK